MKRPSHRTIIITTLVVVIVLFILISSNTLLYLYFITGNDIIVSLRADKENLELVRPYAGSVSFDASVTTNPFCSARCTARFIALGNGTILGEEQFSLSPGKSVSSTYAIASGPAGEGIDAYRYEMECRSVGSAFCHTDGAPTQRSILVTAHYQRSAVEQLLREQVQAQLGEYVARLSALKGRVIAMKESLQEENSRIVLDGAIARAGAIDVHGRESVLASLQSLWESENYYGLRDVIATELVALQREEAAADSVIVEETAVRERYNQIAGELAAIVGLIPSDVPEGTEGFESLRASIETATRAMNARSPIEAKENAVGAAANAYALFEAARSEQQRVNAIRSATIAYAVNFFACKKNCTPPAPDVDAACAQAEAAISNDLPDASFVNETVGNFTNIPLFEGNETVAHALMVACRNTILPDVNVPQIKLLEPPVFPAAPIDITFANQSLTCCSLGGCRACCVEPSCEDSALPVLFIHGHAFNQGTSFDRSLEVFNGLQQQLEQDGLYLKAGAISAYTPQDSPPGRWGELSVPVSIKGSYYYDLFETQGSYVIVQTKSENIDTYAIRMRDIIDTVRYKTGKEKVIVVTHSMGGLVVRRYMQLFGEDSLAGVISIATPHEGITPSMAGYCRVLGHDIECRDMTTGSLLLNKLGREPAPTIPFVNIYGTGCAMDGGDGDGVVLAKNARWERVVNIPIQGKCDGLELFHSKITDVNAHPDVYAAVRDELAALQ